MVENATVSALGLSPEATLVFCIIAVLIVGAVVVIIPYTAIFDDGKRLFV